VHEVAFVVEVLQAEEDLLGNAFDDARRNAFPTVLLDEREKIRTEGLKGDAYVGGGGDGVGERIEKGDYVSSPGVRRGCVGYLAQQFDFISSCL
jgi:hypothetical protein